MDGYQTQTFHAFMGIPYAKPPLGPLRFKSPQKKPKWNDIYDATNLKAVCIKKLVIPAPVIQGEEDCLYLNVYRPSRRHELLPVMVYIHGGGFFSGSAGPAMTGPEYFMDTETVILVTMSYRLGALGFLSTGDINMPGNYGLKDQELALKWVRDNIAYFDGDRNRVTLFGHGAGAVATHLHLLNPYSKHLFHSVITMSGTANVPFGITKNPSAQARQTAELCGIPHAESISLAELTEALREIDVITLINASDGLKEWDVYPLINYRPVVEPPGILESIVSADPEKLIREAKYEKRPWLLGTVPQEGAVRFVNILENTRLLNEFNNRFNYLFEQMMEWPNRFTPSERKDKTESVVVEYLEGVYFLNNGTKQGFMDVSISRLIIYGFIPYPFFTSTAAFYPVFLNSMVHIIMYSYYLVAAVADKKVIRALTPVKKSITVIQMVQFFFILLQAVIQSIRCGVPKVVFTYFVIVVGLMFYGFYDFYNNSYKKSQRRKSLTSEK
uniref:carboxylesterase n=1 Tax=Drosophila willistoni TaxID=7260 RepID=B4MQE6_DROWI